MGPPVLGPVLNWFSDWDPSINAGRSPSLGNYIGSFSSHRIESKGRPGMFFLSLSLYTIVVDNRLHIYIYIYIYITHAHTHTCTRTPTHRGGRGKDWRDGCTLSLGSICRGTAPGPRVMRGTEMERENVRPSWRSCVAGFGRECMLLICLIT